MEEYMFIFYFNLLFVVQEIKEKNAVDRTEPAVTALVKKLTRFRPRAAERKNCGVRIKPNAKFLHFSALRDY